MLMSSHHFMFFICILKDKECVWCIVQDLRSPYEEKQISHSWLFKLTPYYLRQLLFTSPSYQRLKGFYMNGSE